MPVGKLTLLRATFLFTALGLAALLAIVAMSLWLVGQAQINADTVTQFRKLRSGIADLRAAVQDAETSQRGYLLTQDEAYLKPYHEGRDGVSARIALLRTLVGDATGESAAIDRLGAVIVAKLDELDRTVGLAQAGQRDAALAIVRTNAGDKLMEEARTIFERILANADARLTRGLADQRESVSTQRWVAIAGAVVILAVALAAGWMIRDYTRDIVNARLEMEGLNASLEERVRDRVAELARANEEIQRFAYIVTHDLRAPLVNIMGFTSELDGSMAAIQAFVARDTPAPDDAVAREAHAAATQDLPEAIGFIRSSTRKMDGLINAILKLSREGRRTLKPERVDLAALIEATAASVRHQVVEAGGSVTVEPGLPALVSDRLALEQVFGNLVDNAVKYRSPERPLALHIRARRAEYGRVAIEVSDNGRGIAAQDHERVFELFRRSGAQDQAGEGIGLAHVQTLVRNLGGTITLSSEFGRGTTFTVALPPDLRPVLGRSIT